MLRIPGWVRNEVLPSDLYSYADSCEPGYKVMVNGEEVSAALQDGYFCIERRWAKGDRVELVMDMPARVVKAHPLVKDDEGRYAFEKGSIVYCAEWPDNPDLNVREAVLDNDVRLSVSRQDGKLYGIDEIVEENSGLVLIPYYAWNHRGPGDMAVWIRHE
jgi:hypothetical protein